MQATVVHLANTALLNGDPAAATEAVERLDLSTRNPGDPEFDVPVAAALAEAGAEIVLQSGAGAPAAQAYLRKALAAAPTLERIEPVLRLVELVIRGDGPAQAAATASAPANAAAVAGRAEEALSLLRSYVAEEPFRDDSRYHGWLGLCAAHLHRQGGQQAGAAVAGGARRPYNPAQAKAYADEALRSLLRALELDPANEHFAATLAEVLVSNGQATAAETM
eukprot:SAG22_NODE_3975_length_1442_cov_2.008191_1_plen_221_part_10